MPHIIVEYSSNIEPACSAAGLLRCVHQAALDTGIFDPGAVRTRAAPRSLYLIGNGDDPAAGFIHITARIRPGRTDDALAGLLQGLMNATQQYLAAANYHDPLMINVEVHELPPLRAGAKLPKEANSRP